MKKVSGGYVAINPNFVISEIAKNGKVSMDTKGIIAVLKNILLRGAPTIPSVYLREQIGNVKNGKYSYTLGEKNFSWKNIIKGSLTLNPALKFYEKLIEISDDAAFILPECPFTDICYDNDGEISKERAVDFYSPYHRLVVEIDGKQHEEEIQGLSDKDRDKMLFQRSGVITYRIKTSEIDLEEEFIKKVNVVKELLEGNRSQRIKLISQNDISNEQKVYMYVIRFQILLLELIEKGHIVLNENKVVFNLKVHNEEKALAEAAFYFAYEDLKLWISNLYLLANKTVVFPELVLEGKAAFVIDIDIYSRYDENISNNDCIRIRNDYYFYDKSTMTKLYAIFEEDKPPVASLYSQYRNYYTVQNSEFRFNKVNHSNESHKSALEFFLKNIFGFDSFRPNQLEIVAKGLNPANAVIGLLPTGSGKSLCYQLVSFLTPCITLVISPLTLLMDDQKDNLYKRNLIMTAYQLHAKEKDNLNIFNSNQAKILYIAPDRFFNIAFRESMERKSIGQIVVDEVHCLSEWGHDFRTAYLLLFSFLKESSLSKRVLLMGTSATASPNVIDDIRQEFGKVKSYVEEVKATSIRRPELSYSIVRADYYGEKENIIKELVAENFEQEEKTLVFCATKKGAYKVRKWLRAANPEYNAQMYYSGQIDKKDDYIYANDSDEDKEEAYKLFTKGESKVLSATKAFGMGIDIPDIRHTIHFDIASSVEGLYQEMGRAGRDGVKSSCTVVLLDDLRYLSNISNLLKIQSFPISELLDYQKKQKDDYFNGFGALSMQLFLMISSNKEYSEWSKFIISVYNYLVKEVPSGTFDLQNFYDYYRERNEGFKESLKEFRTDFEKALYKLYVLGVIDLWNISYKNVLITNPTYSGVFVISRTSDFIQEKLETHIARYDDGYVYVSKNQEDTLKDYVEALCKWDNDKFLNYRWESLKTLYDMVYNYVDSETFANRIETFLKGSDKLDKLIRGNGSPMSWIKLFSEIDVLKLKDQLARYVAEIQNNKVIEFLQGMIEIKTGKMTNDIIVKFNRVLSYVISQEKDGGFKFINECVYKLDDEQSQIRFLVNFVDAFPEMLSNEKMLKCKELFDKKIWNDLLDRIHYNSLHNSLNKLKSVLGGK